MRRISVETENGSLIDATPRTGSALLSREASATVVAGLQGNAQAGDTSPDSGRYGVAVAGAWGRALSIAEGVAVSGRYGTAISGAQGVAVALSSGSEVVQENTRKGTALGAAGAVAIAFDNCDAYVDGMGIAYGKPGARVAGGPGSVLILDSGMGDSSRYLVARVADPAQGLRGLKAHTWYGVERQSDAFRIVEFGPVTLPPVL